MSEGEREGRRRSVEHLLNWTLPVILFVIDIASCYLTSSYPMAIRFSNIKRCDMEFANAR